MYAMFKFNFNGEGDDSSNKAYEGQPTNHWYASKQVMMPSDITNLLSTISRDEVLKLDYNCGVEFLCLSPKKAINMLRARSGHESFLDVLTADKQQSDLLPGKYEGGLKTWECTKDLVIYFMKQIAGELTNKLNEKAVLDLGCGSGILGIMCLLQGAFVTFQDYNEEVLEAMTIPNILLNCKDSVRNKIELYSGDWASFLHLMTETKNQDLSNIKYDYILTSETIYNPENYKKITEIIKRLLKPEGCAFVAAKAYYFGVGGNLKEFETLIQQEGLQCSTCWESTEGVLRGILEIKIQ